MRRLLPAISSIGAVLALAIAAAPAGATVREIGLPAASPFPTASCPTSPCQAIAQVSGYQVQIGKSKNPFVVHKPGTIVAFTIRLGQPNPQQMQFFQNMFGKEPQVRLTVLKTLRHARNAVLEDQSEVFDLGPYLGSTPTFALSRPLKVQGGWTIGLTVPTWAPAFAVGLGSDQAWRSSRNRSDCNSQQPKPAAQQRVHSTQAYQCFFRTARLLYSATYIPTPTPTNTTTHHRRHRR